MCTRQGSSVPAFTQTNAAGSCAAALGTPTPLVMERREPQPSFSTPAVLVHETQLSDRVKLDSFQHRKVAEFPWLRLHLLGSMRALESAAQQAEPPVLAWFVVNLHDDRGRLERGNTFRVEQGLLVPLDVADDKDLAVAASQALLE